MKSTGIVRRVDELGRIVLPKELRRSFDIKEGDGLEIYIDNQLIVLKKYEPNCIFCSKSEDIVSYKGKSVCKDCLEEMKKGL